MAGADQIGTDAFDTPVFYVGEYGSFFYLGETEKIVLYILQLDSVSVQLDLQVYASAVIEHAVFQISFVPCAVSLCGDSLFCVCKKSAFLSAVCSDNSRGLRYCPV